MINLCILKVSGRVFCINFFLFFGEGGGGLFMIISFEYEILSY